MSQPFLSVDAADDARPHTPDTQDDSQALLQTHERLQMLLQEHEKSFSQVHNRVISGPDTRNAWQDTAAVIENYSNATVKRWLEDINGLLTFASLLATFITLFLGQTYPMLQRLPESPSAVLTLTPGRIASYTDNPSFATTTTLPFDATVLLQQSGAPPATVQLNILLFIALVLSLAAASIGLLTQQWINEYTIDLFGKEREIARRRQYRLRQMHKWKVPSIIAAIPVLLQLSLVFFLVGLSMLMFTLDELAAAVIVPLICLLLAFIVITTFLPAIHNDCCYYSLQSRVIFDVFEILRSPLFSLISRLSCFPFYTLLADSGLASWFAPRTWRQHEMYLSYSKADEAIKLEGKMLAMAFKLTMNSDRVRKANFCLVDRANIAFFHKYLKAVANTLAEPWTQEGPTRWLNGVLREYRKVLSVAIQFSLTKVRSELREGALKLVRDVSTHDPIPDYSDLLLCVQAPRPIYNDLLFRTDKGQDEDTPGVDRAYKLRLLAILCMPDVLLDSSLPEESKRDSWIATIYSHAPAPSKSRARMAWDCIVWKMFTENSLTQMTPDEALSVSTAASYVLNISRKRMNSPDMKYFALPGSTSPSGRLPPILSAPWRTDTPTLSSEGSDVTVSTHPYRQVHWDYMDALRIYLHCLTQSPPSSVVHSSAKDVLASFAVLLHSETWVFLCTSMEVALRFDEVIISITDLLYTWSTRDLVTDQLLDTLKQGLDVIDETLAREHSSSLWYAEKCRRMLNVLQKAWQEERETPIPCFRGQLGARSIP